MTDDNPIAKRGAQSVVVRSQKMAAALSSYARALTFENRSRRNLYRLAGFTPRTRDRIFTGALVFLFVSIFALPMAGSVVYYTFIASPRYISEVSFIVRSSAPILSRNRYSSETVEPQTKIVQDTAVLLNYLISPGMLQDVQRTVDLKQMFGRADIDYFSRLSEYSTQEKMMKYWKKMVVTSVNPKSGIVELEVAAFSPREAHDLLQVVLKLAEEQINRLSAGMWSSLQLSSQRDVDVAARELTDLRAKLRDTQNETGVYNIDLTADSIMSVLTNLESSIADLKSKRDALSRSIANGSPKLLDIDRQIAAKEGEAKALWGKTAGSSGDSGGNLADYSNVFNKLNLDLKMAENKLQSAIEENEKVNLVSSLQLIYVDNFTDPTIPDESKYPNVPLSLLFSFLCFAALWGLIAGGTILLRQKLD